MSSNILIVESKNDKYFLQAIIRYLNLNIEVTSPIIISEEDYRAMDGLNKTKLTNALKDLKADIQKGEIERVGIIIDIDNDQESDRINFINECVQEAFTEAPLLVKVKEFVNLTLDGLNIQLACYFTNLDGQGELETVLKSIKSQDSVHADCLKSWENCLQNHGQKISVKEFDKFWVDMYIRFDTCSKTEKKQAERK
ncbi:hypothetical protein FD723_05975 [Nostoc sp. C052]|uniref:DUF3226 domain-containing protein n=1 Tax=Nostoc sp. C052 TaxID=2576902 RepID=UPI0015C3342F|nr:DUF3226 domain-containing protein [Nostoc sp. C052]QLE40047.1 hypothetical protein FD723_05975 [Nostoc sp. C052]